MAKEVKLGLGFLAVLLAVFVSLLFYRLSGRRSEAPPALAEQPSAQPEPQHAGPRPNNASPSVADVFGPTGSPSAQTRPGQEAEPDPVQTAAASAEANPAFADRYADWEPATEVADNNDARTADEALLPSRTELSTAEYAETTTTTAHGPGEVNVPQAHPARESHNDPAPLQPAALGELHPLEQTAPTTVAAVVRPTAIADDDPFEARSQTASVSAAPQPIVTSTGDLDESPLPVNDSSAPYSPTSQRYADPAAPPGNLVSGDAAYRPGSLRRQPSANFEPRVSPQASQPWSGGTIDSQPSTSGRASLPSDEPSQLRYPSEYQGRYDDDAGPNALVRSSETLRTGTTASDIFSRRGGQYTVMVGDSFWSIAEAVYGDGAYFRALYEHNRRDVPSPERLKPGTVLDVPPLDVLAQTYPSLCPVSARPQSPTPPLRAVGASSAPRPGAGRYVVEEGDTLFDIAKYELGSASRWSEIYELNRDRIGPNVNILRPGTELTLPPRDRPASVTQAPRDSVGPSATRY